MKDEWIAQDAKNLRPIADYALWEWYGEAYGRLRLMLRVALAQDIAEIMIEEDIRPATGIDAIVAVMIIDLRIHPASLSSYAETLSG